MKSLHAAGIDQLADSNEPAIKQFRIKVYLVLEKICPRCHKPLTFISGDSEGRDDNQGQRRRMRRPKPRRFRGESDGYDRKERSLVTSNYFQTNENSVHN